MKRPCQRFGDKKNSEYFEEFLPKLYDWRESVGLTEMIHEMHSFTIEVEEHDRCSYLLELALMTPYQFRRSYESDTFIYSLLEVDEKSPGFIVRSRKNPEKSQVISMNMLSPVAMKKPYTRYIGESYRVTGFDNLIEVLEKSGVQFINDGQARNSSIKFARTNPSQYTWNTVGYVEYENQHREYYLEQFPEYAEEAEFLEKFKAVKEKQKILKISELIQPVDHLATRILHQDREHAILEFMKLTSYYYWGSYDISEQNSSTNVSRNSHDLDESVSPAKVFTAANTPHYIDHLVHLPSPTESFVRNYGKRMHHVAYSIRDNEEGQDYDNIDFVVDNLKDGGIDFLLKVIGSSDEGLKQIFSRTSKYSLLITEYIQRYNGFQGFFTKKNVAFLTKAAGADEELQKDGSRIGECDLCD